MNKKTRFFTAAVGALLLGAAAQPAQATVADYDVVGINLTFGSYTQEIDLNGDVILDDFADGLNSAFNGSGLTFAWFAQDPYVENGFSFTIQNAGPNTFSSGSALGLDVTLDLLFYDETLTPFPSADSGSLSFDLRDFLPGEEFDPGESFVATFLLSDLFTAGSVLIQNPLTVSPLQGVYLSGAITAVPLPAAGWLLLSGLGILGATARRRRAAVAAA